MPWIILKKDLIFRNDKGEVIKIFPYGSKEQQSWEEGIKILADLFFMWRKEKLEVQLQQKEIAEHRERISQKISSKRIKRSTETYNLTQVAQALGVHRQTLYYWIKKGWIKPRRDYRDYPVFTVLDIQGLKRWLNSFKPGNF